nr:uncharacterized protein LOC117276382 [Nicotiana tomentosiformis]
MSAAVQEEEVGVDHPTVAVSESVEISVAGQVIAGANNASLKASTTGSLKAGVHKVQQIEQKQEVVNRSSGRSVAANITAADIVASKSQPVQQGKCSWDFAGEGA